MMAEQPSPDPVFDIGPLSDVPFEVRKRESVRERLAVTLTYTLIGTVAFLLIIVVLLPDRALIIKDIAPVLIGPLIGIYGAVIGFYFGSSK